MAAAILLAGALVGATPLPPRRPPELTPPSAPAPQPAPTPDKAAPPEAAPNAGPQRQPVDVDAAQLQPYNLPPASRQRMRLCGERWRDLKMAGESAGLTWRSFAEKCLPGVD